MDCCDDDLEPIQSLGEGTYGNVFLCKSRSLNNFCCIKSIYVENLRAQVNMVYNEVYIISQLKHPRIIQFHRSFIHDSTINIVMEFACGGTLRDVIKQNINGILSNSVTKYFSDIVMGLEYLYIRRVVHRDLKPENILLDGQDRVKIADFGIAFIHHSNSSNVLKPCGTPYYLAPEIFIGSECDFKSDVWSLGCILYEMCMGMSPFGHVNTIKDLHKCLLWNSSLYYKCTKLKKARCPVWGNLCEKMLTFHPSGRISLPEIIKFDAMITIPLYTSYFDYNY